MWDPSHLWDINWRAGHCSISSVTQEEGRQEESENDLFGLRRIVYGRTDLSSLYNFVICPFSGHHYLFSIAATRKWF